MVNFLGTAQNFARALHALIPGLQTRELGPRGCQTRHCVGVGLTKPDPADENPKPAATAAASHINNEEHAPRAFYWDVETRSAAWLPSVGARAYAGDPSTEVLCVRFALGDGPIEIWTPDEPVPGAVLSAAADPAYRWIAHNAAFERAILAAILIPRFGWPMVPVERHACSMALALAHAYPGALEAASEILGLVNRKDAVREKRVRQMWSPRKPRKGEPPGLYWIDDPELRAELH